jgi:hypothetical protein
MLNTKSVHLESDDEGRGKKNLLNNNEVNPVIITLVAMSADMDCDQAAFHLDDDDNAESSGFCATFPKISWG